MQVRKLARVEGDETRTKSRVGGSNTIVECTGYLVDHGEVDRSSKSVNLRE